MIRAYPGKISLDVSGANSTGNATIKDVIGNKTDTYAGDSLYSYIDMFYNHFHAAQFVYPKKADAVLVAGGSTAWGLGNFVEIVPANAITNQYDVHWVSYSEASVTDEYYFEFYKGSTGQEVLIFEDCTVRDTAVSGSEDSRVQHIPLPANTRLSVKMASKSGGGDSIRIKIKGHSYS